MLRELDLSGKTCLVTGGTSGIGRATAEGLARLGARVLLPARDLARGRDVAGSIQSATGAQVEARPGDLASQASIRAFAASCLEDLDRLDVLVNSAGVVTYQREETQDGLESCFGVTYLGAFLLTRLLLDLLLRSAPARVVNVAGEYHRKVRLEFDDLQLEHGRFGLVRAGGQAMLCKVMFTIELARRLEGAGVTVNALHPGAVRSGLLRNLPLPLRALGALAGPFLRSPEAGARTALFLAASPEVAGISGEYFRDERVAAAAAHAHDVEACRRLWDESERLAGLPPLAA